MTTAVATKPRCGVLRVRVLLFGSLRDLAGAPELALEVPRGTTGSGLRRHLREALSRGRPGRDALVESSALAGDDGILVESEVLAPDADELRVALLPPVCGG